MWRPPGSPVRRTCRNRRRTGTLPTSRPRPGCRCDRRRRVDTVKMPVVQVEKTRGLGLRRFHQTAFVQLIGDRQRYALVKVTAGEEEKLPGLRVNTARRGVFERRAVVGLHDRVHDVAEIVVGQADHEPPSLRPRGRSTQPHHRALFVRRNRRADAHRVKQEIFTSQRALFARRYARDRERVFPNLQNQAEDEVIT